MQDRTPSSNGHRQPAAGETHRCNTWHPGAESDDAGSHSTALDAAVIVSDPNARRQLRELLRRIGVRHHTYDAERFRHGTPPAGLYCLCMRAIATLGTVPLPALAVCCGATVSDSVVSLVAEATVQPVDISDLTEEGLLQAIVNATDSQVPNLLGLKLHLASHPGFRLVPAALIDRFVEEPAEVSRLCDIRKTLGKSSAVCRTLLHSAGFERVEYLRTALRAEAWIWFAQRGFRRALFEKRLGIRDKTTFRRSCRRADVAVPWSGKPSGEI